MYAMEFDKDLKEGDCKAQGYTLADGVEVQQVSIFGDVTIKKFKKAATLPDEVTLWKVTGDVCTEFTDSKMFEKFAMEFDSDLKEGDCKTQGYTIPDGERDVQISILGTIHYKDFLKTPNFQSLI